MNSDTAKTIVRRFNKEVIEEGLRSSFEELITGQHVGAFFGIAPRGRTISIDVIDIVRVLNGRYVEHWGINTLPSVLAQLRTAGVPASSASKEGQ